MPLTNMLARLHHRYRKLTGKEYRTPAQVNDAYRAGRVSLDQVRAWYIAEGYSLHFTELYCKWLDLIKRAEEDLHARR